MFVGLVLLLGGESLIAPRQHKIQASASDQVRAYESTLYEIHTLYQLPIIRAIFLPQIQVPRPTG